LFAFIGSRVVYHTLDAFTDDTDGVRIDIIFHFVGDRLYWLRASRPV
jgi:hypothetical protein